MQMSIKGVRCARDVRGLMGERGVRGARGARGVMDTRDMRQLQRVQGGYDAGTSGMRQTCTLGVGHTNCHFFLEMRGHCPYDHH